MLRSDTTTKIIDVEIESFSLSQQIAASILLPDTLRRDVTNNQSLATRLKEDLINDLPVSIVSIFLAVITSLTFSIISSMSTGGVLLALNIAVFIPYAYERYWPVAYSTGTAAIWTLSAALITTGLFIGVYQLTLGVLSNSSAPAIAFVVTVVIQYGTAALFARVRRDE